MDINKEKSVDHSYKFIMNGIEKVVEIHVHLKGICQYENKIRKKKWVRK